MTTAGTRTIGVVTVARSDFGIYIPVLQAIKAHPRLQAEVIATGMHLSPEFGMTVDGITEAGFEVCHRVPSLADSEIPAGVAASMGQGVLGFAELFSQWRPDVLLVLGDRFDMIPAALAALPFHIPVAHIHGGEVTEGAFDDALRHAITKFSHLHFVTTEEHGRRVRQLGEESWRVTVSGAPGLDRLLAIDRRARDATLTGLGLDPGRPFALVTFHPPTMEPGAAGSQAGELVDALRALDLPCVITAPNADPEHQAVRQVLEAYVTSAPATARWIENAGATGYASLLAAADVMLGNSSSGIIEAASFELPVVNVGDRQRGRTRAANVIDVAPERAAIEEALRRALHPEFRETLRGMQNPYGDGHASVRIADRLASVDLSNVTIKRFQDC